MRFEHPGFLLLLAVIIPVLLRRYFGGERRGTVRFSDVGRFRAHEPVGLPVDPDHASQAMVRAGPVHRPGVGQVIGGRPDAEIGISREEWHSRWAKAIRAQVHARGGVPGTTELTACRTGQR